MAKPPLAAQVLADALADRIRSGELKAGMYLPAERQLAAQFGVSRGTVRQAIARLAAAELVDRPEGSAARVRPAVAGEALDPAGVAEELAAIRAELREVNSRLSAIEARGSEGASTG